MFISCLHCRELVAIDPDTRLAPEMCPRCGGVLRESATGETPAAEASSVGERSFISFLQDGGTAAPTAAATTSAAEGETVRDETSADPGSLVQPSEESAKGGAAAETVDETAADIEGREINTAQYDAIVAPVAPVAPMPASAAAAAAQTLPATPSFTRQTARSGPIPRTARWQWALLIILSLTLLLQVLLADRARLAADATWRPLIVSLCGALGCSIPPWHQPGAFAMLSRDVSPIRGSTGGLNVRATFRNDARWAQAWPLLLLSLSDADGRVLGSRAFTPREYLGATAAQTELAPGQSAQIALQLHEPDPDVVAFTFDFR
jgi:hypothetical protein